jgi:hypothetical protein
MKHPTSNTRHPTLKGALRSLFNVPGSGFDVFPRRIAGLILFLTFAFMASAADTNTAFLFSFFRVEGPSAIQNGNEFMIYFDHYTAPQYYGAVKSADLKNWQDVSPQVKLPQGARHGTILKVPESIIQALQTPESNLK